MKKQDTIEDPILRKKAVALHKKRLSNTDPEFFEADIHKLIHELEVHQIELELQNEELHLAKNAAAELASDKYVALYDFAPLGYFTLSKEGLILDLNLSGSNMLGRERSFLKSSSFGFFVTENTKPIFNLFLGEVFSSKNKETCEVTLETKGNLPMHVFLTGIITNHGESCLVIGVDITKRRREEINLKEKNDYIEAQNEAYSQINKELAFQIELREKRAAELVIANEELIFQNKEKEKRAAELVLAKEKAEESDRLKSAFLANMSHEIRTPMNGILGFAELLKEADLSGESQQRYINIIEKSGHRMLNIINDIICISKIESGQMGISISETNVNEQIEYLCTFFKPEVEQKGIQISFRNTLSDKEAVIETDREKIYAILTNLVKNAIKFTRTGNIEFGCRLKPNPFRRDKAILVSNGLDTATDELEFFVKDTGIGIRPDILNIVFERFRQGNESLTKNYEGAGLGLSISKAYVEMLGGRIWVESEEGIGSTFYFTIPYQKHTDGDVFSNKLIRTDPDTKTEKKLNILIAEDDEGSEILLSIAIQKLSKNVLKAKTGLEAIGICRNNPDIDLVLMDIQMPVMDGYEATRQIREFNKDLVIIAQTAYALSGDKEKALAAGCTDYLSKPIRKDILLEVVNKYF